MKSRVQHTNVAGSWNEKKGRSGIRSKAHQGYKFFWKKQDAFERRTSNTNEGVTR